MENQKLGILLITIAVLVTFLIFAYNNQLTDQAELLGCFPDDNCLPIQKTLTLTHFAIGIIAFILALGFFLLFFNKTEQRILRRLEQEHNKTLDNEKFKYILMGLDSFEQEVIQAVKEQDGITQNTLKLRVNMSKAKLSQVLKDLENKNLIKKVEQGKTSAIHLKF